MRPYPVITLYQPWATWIMRGWKTIETRKHDRFSNLLFRTILIHAGQQTDGSAIFNPYLTQKQLAHDPDEMINGFILGSAFVKDFRVLNKFDSACALIDCGTVKRFGLFLEAIQKFDKPIPASGEQGIWYFDLDSLQKVKASGLTNNDPKLF